MHFPVEQSPATLAAKPQKNEEDRIRLKMIQALNQALREANFDEVVRQSGYLARYHAMGLQITIMPKR